MNHAEASKIIPDYVVGELDAEQASKLDEHLVTCASCAAEFEAACAIHRFAASGAESAPPGLRSNVLSAAFEARPPAPVPAATTSPEFAAWEAEIGRFRALLEDPLLGPRLDLVSSGWDVPCVEKFDLSVRSMVCHLIAAESLRADQLRAPVAAIPEASRSIESRTRAVIERHSALPVAATINEFERVTLWTGEQLRRLDTRQRAEQSGMAPGFTVDEYTALRALETWTHADDIRLALGQHEVKPETVHISTMTSVLPRWISFVLAAAPDPVRDRHYRIHLTGLSERTLDIAPLSTSLAPAVTITCDAVEFCKLAGARRDPATFSYEATDPSPAEALVHAMADFELI